MIARGFKPVVWVAAVGAAALGCYMLSLRVASERADLTSLQRRIVATQEQIRALQTEVGTRGRLAQLEQWNDDVLALAPPSSAQFVQAAQLARFGGHEATPLDDGAQVQLAAADAPPAPAAAPAPTPPAPTVPVAQHAVAAAPAVAAPAPLRQATVQRASLTLPPQPTPAPRRPLPPAHPATPSHSAAAPLHTASATPPRPAPPAHPAAASPRTRTASTAPTAHAASASHRGGLLDARTLRELGSAARAERGGGARD